MHILMTTDTVGGVWTYSLELARSLRAFDVEVSLATMGEPLTDSQRREANTLANIHVHESSFRLEWMDAPWDQVASAGEWLLELGRDLRPDLVHLNQYSFGSIHWDAPCVVVGHSCVLSWYEAVRSQPADVSWNIYRSVVSEGIQEADFVVAPTQTMLDALNRYYGPLSRTQVIWNGRRPDYGRLIAKQPFVLTAGRLWDEAKNTAAVAEVAADLKWPVHAAGIPHPAPQDTQHWFDDHLIYLGRLSAEEMEETFSAASIYALPVRYEPFGLTVLEAALAGCALVLGDIASLRELWGDAALYVDPDDRRGLRAAINRLIDDAELRNQLAAKSRARARRLSDRRMACKYFRLYRQLIQMKSRRSPGMVAVPSPDFPHVHP